jgi:hypothetical protein
VNDGLFLDVLVRCLFAVVVLAVTFGFLWVADHFGYGLYAGGALLTGVVFLQAYISALKSRGVRK